ncbi:MAG: hypothetical protein GEU96_18975 [Propionibacteriales bacterium]|nr:hypothetical protein [Propionibacteriales bacterium]
MVSTLRVAAVLVALEAFALVVVGVGVTVAGSVGRLVLDVTTTLFFVACAAGLLACVRGLLRRRSWARGPVVFAQLVQLGVGWSFTSGSTRPVAAALVAVAVVVLALVLAPPTTRALVADRPAGDDS